MIYASIIFLISLSVYLVALFNFKRGLIFKKITSENVNSPPVSVVVAVRNGEKNCTRLLNSLQKQNYSGQLEFLIVDDASSDNTPIIINDFSSFDNVTPCARVIISTKSFQQGFTFDVMVGTFGVSP